MTLRNSTLVIAALLALGLNLGSVSDAFAGEGCSHMRAGYGKSYAPAAAAYGRYNSPRWAAAGGYHHYRYPAPTMAPPAPRVPMHPAMYWGTQPAQALKASAEKGAADADIVDVAVGAGDFTTLMAAVKAAGLVETLKGEGPFTVFAPTDEAFAKIPEADLQALLADKDALTAVLTYHVVPGKVMAADVVGMNSAETVQGSSITIDTSDGVTVDGANVVKTDIAASNGVIHVIDSVIIPN